MSLGIVAASHVPFGDTPLTTVSYVSNGFNGLLDYCRTNSVSMAADQVASFGTTYVAASGVDGAGGAQVHTNSAADRWYRVSLASTHSIIPTQVSIRGRDDANVHHLRNFKIQGTNDGSTFDDLATVSGAGPGQGTWYNVSITTTTQYRSLRILQTGADSSGGNYLTLSEVEVYGSLYETSFPTGSPTTSVALTSSGYNGLMDYCIDNSISLTASQSATYSTWDGSYALDQGASSTPAATTNAAGSWWRVQVGGSYGIVADFVSILGRQDTQNNNLRNFKVQGSNDGSTWTDLYTSAGFGPTQSQWIHVPIFSSTEYAYWRVLSTGVDYSGGNFTILGEFEAYGHLYS